MSKKHLTDQHVIQRAVVLQLLRDDRPHRWTRKKLKREISDVKGRAIDKALEYLGSEDVVHLEDKEVWASLCAQHLDELGMVSL